MKNLSFISSWLSPKNDNREFQLEFSKEHPDITLEKKRKQKANKMLSILSEVGGGELKSKRLLDVGCSTGIMTKLYAEKFGEVIGIDIDRPAIQQANQNNSTNATFFCQNAENTVFEEESFDIVSCTQIYEHVPDSKKIMLEIYRVLKPGGICYFSASNRLNLIEPHYNLPLLSVIPKPFAHLYLKMLGRGNYYYENHLTLWGLKKLVSDFTILDFTKKVIDNPEKYFATEMLTPNSIKQKIAQLLLQRAYFLFPNYVWILQKDNNSNESNV